MPTYEAHFRGDSAWASREFRATTPQRALANARRFYQRRWLDLDFESYEPRFGAIDEIEIFDAAGKTVAVWHSSDLLLCQAAPKLLDAARLALRELREFYLDGDSQAIITLKAAISEATSTIV